MLWSSHCRMISIRMIPVQNTYYRVLYFFRSFLDLFSILPTQSDQISCALQYFSHVLSIILQIFFGILKNICYGTWKVQSPQALCVKNIRVQYLDTAMQIGKIKDCKKVANSICVYIVKKPFSMEKYAAKHCFSEYCQSWSYSSSVTIKEAQWIQKCCNGKLRLQHLFPINIGEDSFGCITVAKNKVVSECSKYIRHQIQIYYRAYEKR